MFNLRKILLATLFIFPTLSYAQEANIGFEDGNINNWTTGGGTSSQTPTQYDGNGQGVGISTGITDLNTGGPTWTVTPYGNYMVTAQPSGQSTFNDMTTALGLRSDSVTDMLSTIQAQAVAHNGSPTPTDAAWFMRSVTMTSGQTLTMSWNYLSTDYVPFNDGSIATMVNTTDPSVNSVINNHTGQYALLGFTNPGTGDYSTDSYGSTGWQKVTFHSTSAGTYKIGFGVFNLGDTALSPILSVDEQSGTTLKDGVTFSPVAPNAGSGAPDNSGSGSPTVVSTAPGTPIVTSSNVDGTPVVTSITNTNLVSSTDANGNPVVTTYFTVTTTTTTPTTTTTTTTPVTVTTYSDGSTTTTNGTPVTTSVITNTATSTTTDPAIQSVATTEPVTTTSTSSGTATTTTSTVNLAPIDTITKSYTSSKEGGNITVTQTTTTVTDHPSTVTTTVTTPITTTTTVTPTTTTVDANGNVIGTAAGTPTSTDSTVNQNVSSTQDVDTYTSSVTHANESVDIGGANDALNASIVHPFTVDPLMHGDGSWADYSMSSGNKIGNSTVNFGYQKTVEDVTVGVAGSVGKASSDGVQNSTVIGETYAGTAYVLNKGDLAWTKGSIGFGLNNYTIGNSIASFGLANQTKLQQKTAYADLTFYSAKDYAGWKPFAGVTVLNSDIGNVQESGSSLLSSGITASNKTYTMPYVGIQKEVTPGIVVEAKATQTEAYGTVVSGKVIAKKNITDKVSINVSAGVDKGQNYDGLSIMAGLVIKF